MTARSWISATTFIRPSHRGHWSTSHPHTRCSNVAHAMRDDTFRRGHAVGVVSHAASHAAAPSFPVTCVASVAAELVAPGVVGRGVAARASSSGLGPGTTAGRHGEFGANTPWYLTSGRRGGGISATSLAMKSMGSMMRWVSPRPLWLLQPPRDAPVGQFAHPIERHRGARGVAQQPLTARAVLRADHHAGVEVEALGLRHLRLRRSPAEARRVHRLARLDRAVVAHHPVAAPRERGPSAPAA